MFLPYSSLTYEGPHYRKHQIENNNFSVTIKRMVLHCFKTKAGMQLHFCILGQKQWGVRRRGMPEIPQTDKEHQRFVSRSDLY